MKVRKFVAYCIYFLILYLSSWHASRVLQQVMDE